MRLVARNDSGGAVCRPGCIPTRLQHGRPITLHRASLRKKNSEFNQELWLGLVDFEKAFDTVEHDTLWAALLEQGVPLAYVNLLQTLYKRQTATIMAGEESRSFAISRGVKQGDPISSFLFVVVMESIFRTLKKRWGRLNAQRAGQYYGIVLDDPQDPLTNLRFADDVLLIASSKRDVGRMLADLSVEAAKYGLKIHMGKTAILTNTAAKRPDSIECRGESVRVVQPEGAEKYLGRKFAMDKYHQTELAHRIASGWGAFFKSKEILCNRALPLFDRLRLFEATVTPCVLYACGTWTLSADLERQLRSSQRRMLRWIVGVRRHPDEEFVEYIKRATHTSNELALQSGVHDWVVTQRVRKWKLAGNVARRQDGRWSQRILAWRPWFRKLAYRDVGRPVQRWDDSIVAMAGSSWTDAARDQNLWEALSFGYSCRVA